MPIDLGRLLSVAIGAGVSAVASRLPTGRARARQDDALQVALVRIECLEKELAAYAAPVVDGQTIGEWRSVGVSEPWAIRSPARVRALLAAADRKRVADAVYDLIWVPGADTSPEAEDRRIVELVCAVLGVQ